jgi:hypothetical protein
MNSLKGAVWAFVVALVLSFAALTFVFLRGEDTRDRVRVVERTVDPCVKPQSRACQRRIRLVLKQLARRHPGELRRLGLVPRDAGSKGVTAPVGGDAFGSPTGGGPVGRVPSPGGSPPESSSPEPPGGSEPDRPAVDLDAPLVPKVCVGDLLAVNC